MTRTYFFVSGLLALVGVGIGWYLYTSSEHSGCGKCDAGKLPIRCLGCEWGEPTGDGSGANAGLLAGKPALLLQPLAQADINLDRETTALAVTASGEVLLAWAAVRNENERVLWLARSTDQGKSFAPPLAFRTVPVHRFTSLLRGKELTRTTNVLPRLAVKGETVCLGWTESSGDAANPVSQFLVADSVDGGVTFGPARCVHSADAVRPTFTALHLTDSEQVCASWLDHRTGVQLPRYSLSSLKLAPEEHAVFTNDLGVCPCCDTDIVRSATGTVVVAYRHQLAGNRDIYVTKSQPDGTFLPPTRVTTDAWAFEGCPHDGPSLALVGNRVHVVFMSGHSGERKVYHAQADLSDLAFTVQPLDSKSPGEQAHPRLAVQGDSLHVVWDVSVVEPTKDDAEVSEKQAPVGKGHEHSSVGGRMVMYTRAKLDEAFAPAQPVQPTQGTMQVNPALAISEAGEVFVSWSELSKAGKALKLVRLP